MTLILGIAAHYLFAYYWSSVILREDARVGGPDSLDYKVLIFSACCIGQVILPLALPFTIVRWFKTRKNILIL